MFKITTNLLAYSRLIAIRKCMANYIFSTSVMGAFIMYYWPNKMQFGHVLAEDIFKFYTKGARVTRFKRLLLFLRYVVSQIRYFYQFYRRVWTRQSTACLRSSHYSVLCYRSNTSLSPTHTYSCRSRRRRRSSIYYK